MTPIELPNHVPASHDGWVNNEIESLVQKGSLTAWSTVADTKTQPRPRICLPLGVEPSKPRLIWDARYLNPMCKHSPFQMDGVGKVAQCSWKGVNKSHWTISRVFTISRWPPKPGNTSDRGRRRRKRCTMPLTRNTQTHDLITKLFWLQVKEDLGDPLGMLRGELGGRQFDQTRTYGTRQAIPGGVQ